MAPTDADAWCVDKKGVMISSLAETEAAGLAEVDDEFIYFLAELTT